MARERERTTSLLLMWGSPYRTAQLVRQLESGGIHPTVVTLANLGYGCTNLVLCLVPASVPLAMQDICQLVDGSTLKPGESCVLDKGYIFELPTP